MDPLSNLSIFWLVTRPAAKQVPDLPKIRPTERHQVEASKHPRHLHCRRVTPIFGRQQLRPRSWANSCISMMISIHKSNHRNKLSKCVARIPNAPYLPINYVSAKYVLIFFQACHKYLLPPNLYFRIMAKSLLKTGCCAVILKASFSSLQTLCL